MPKRFNLLSLIWAFECWWRICFVCSLQPAGRAKVTGFKDPPRNAIDLQSHVVSKPAGHTECFPRSHVI